MRAVIRTGSDVPPAEGDVDGADAFGLMFLGSRARMLGPRLTMFGPFQGLRIGRASGLAVLCGGKKALIAKKWKVSRKGAKNAKGGEG